MLVVGEFLDNLSQKSLTKEIPGQPQPQLNFAQPLYSFPSYSQLDLLCLVLRIFSGIPEAYQVLHCRTTTTEEELSLFLKRVEKHHAVYLVLAVNVLQYKLQEVRMLL